MKNDNPSIDEKVTISWLRDEAERLIHELTSEIQCEQEISQCNRKGEGKFMFI